VCSKIPQRLAEEQVSKPRRKKMRDGLTGTRDATNILLAVVTQSEACKGLAAKPGRETGGANSQEW
jgi:hypothetical protein